MTSMATIEEAKKALLKVFLTFPTSGSELERKLKFEAYWDVLGNQPARHIIEACKYATQGKCDDAAEFMPSAAQLYRLAQDFAEREARNLPKKPDPVLLEHRDNYNERARISQGLRDLMLELAHKNAA